ncbi:MAG: BON domain-containing protein [Pseudobdellovibrionaceae bacterium]
MADSRQINPSRTGQKNRNAFRSNSSNPAKNNFQSPNRQQSNETRQRKSEYNSDSTRRKNNIPDQYNIPNEPIEAQGFDYDFPDRSEEPFYRAEEYANRDFDRYTQGSFWQNQYTNPEIMGPHAGKGPKGYKRSDERIFDDVCETLTRNPLIDAQNIEVKVKNGVVSLSGSVPERRMRYFTEETAANAVGVNDVINNLHIQKTPDKNTKRSSPSSH